MAKDDSEQASVREDMLRFRAGFDSLNLATVSKAGLPEASAAPMILDQDGAFYVFISALARHTANLRSNPKAGVLLIEPVESASNPFARRRLSYQCTAETVARETGVYVDILQRFEQRFGEIVEILRSLPDFELFRLTPINGTFVRGFGQAWRLHGMALTELEPVNPARDRGADADAPGSDR